MFSPLNYVWEDTRLWVHLDDGRGARMLGWQGILGLLSPGCALPISLVTFRWQAPFTTALGSTYCCVFEGVAKPTERGMQRPLTSTLLFPQNEISACPGQCFFLEWLKSLAPSELIHFNYSISQEYHLITFSMTQYFQHKWTSPESHFSHWLFLVTSWSIPNLFSFNSHLCPPVSSSVLSWK